MNIEDSYRAYCLDEAVSVLGNGILARLDEVEDKNPKRAEQKRLRLLNQLLGLGDSPGQYRDPTTVSLR